MQSELFAIGLFFAGGLSGATGLAFPVVAGPLILLEYPPPQAVMMTSICSLVGQLLSITLLHKAVPFRITWHFILPGLLLIPVGTLMLLTADSTVIRIGFGAMLSVSSLCMLLRGPILGFRSKIIDAIVGACGGFCGGAFGASSVLPAFWFCAQGLDRRTQRGIVQPYIVSVQLVSLGSLLVGGAYSGVAAFDILLWLPTVLAGVTFGSFVFSHLQNQLYSRAIFLITLASSLVLVVWH